MSQVEINIWEQENIFRIVKWVKDFEQGTITFILDDVKSGEQVTFKIDK